MRPEDVPTELVELTAAAEKAARDLSAWVRKIQAQALREAANDWQTGAWANVPRRADRVADRLGAAQYVCDWLRKRAARLTATTEEPTT